LSVRLSDSYHHANTLLLLLLLCVCCIRSLLERGASQAAVCEKQSWQCTILLS